MIEEPFTSEQLPRRMAESSPHLGAKMRGIAMKRIQIGSQVRIAGGAALHAMKDLRPEPGQMVWAGREASVTGYRRSPDDRPLYALKGAPGFWLEEWIDPI